MTRPTLTLEQSTAGPVARLSGGLVTEALDAVAPRLSDLPAGDLTLDLSGLDGLDTGGAYLIEALRDRREAAGAAFHLTGVSDGHAALIDTVRRAMPEPAVEDERPQGFKGFLENLGRGVAASGKALASLLSFFGLMLLRLGAALLRPWTLRGAALFSQMEEVGFKAIPIVALMGFLIGVVLAYQGAAQLRQFGAEVFVVDLIAISILRELGILLTAIIVAGRSGSAFTASLGSMKVQEEIDAMEVLGLDPMDVLVLPRLIALVIMLPILGFIANMAGLVGGGLMSWLELGVSPGMFVTRLHNETDIWHLLVGMIKAPFFAVVIATVSCWQAFQVKGSAVSVGQRTTASVVQAIFLVIAMDALFSIFFAELGV